MADKELIERKSAQERQLRCPLTQEEQNTVAGDLANAIARKKEAENDLASMSKQMKSQIASIEAEIDKLAPVVAARAEYRKVKCEKILNYTTGRVEFIRTDTGESVEKRDMYEDEKQGQLKLGTPEHDALDEDPDTDPDDDTE